ncbi:MAG: GLPGLI family protein [Flavobacteriaceae bacterium]|nr:GLPGLI family protein [Flavobacteriaceae bacterium]
MINLISKICFFILTFLLSSPLFAQDFQGKAYYFSKSTMELGSFGDRMTEAQKKQIFENLKNRLEKTYVLTFNKEESFFKEEDKLDAISGATDTWGKNFTPGEQYKNIKTNMLLQSQEFYGKRFLVKDDLLTIDWQLSRESKQIGQYTSFKATAMIPSSQLTWYDFSWGELSEDNSEEVKMTKVTAWYSSQIPVSQGPLEYWGLPGLILEVSFGNTTMLCSKIIMNPKEKEIIEAPDKGKIVTKMEYKEIISGKMQEMRDNRGRPRN